MRISDWSSDVCSSDLLRHPRGRGAGARTVGKDMAEDDVGIVDQGQAVGEHLVILGRKSGDQVGADGDGGPRGLETLDQPHHVGAAMAELRSEEHTSELQSLMRISYAVICLKHKTQ